MRRSQRFLLFRFLSILHRTFHQCFFMEDLPCGCGLGTFVICLPPLAITSSSSSLDFSALFVFCVPYNLHKVQLKSIV